MSGVDESVDLKRVDELTGIIQEAVSQHFPGESITWDGLLGQTSDLYVGGDHAWVSLQDIEKVVGRDKHGTVRQKTGMHRICVETSSTPRKSFRENSQGWFSVDEIVHEAVTKISLERDRRIRNEATRETYEEAVRLNSQYNLDAIAVNGGWITSVSPSACVLNKLDVMFSGLTKPEVERLLTVVRDLGIISESRGTIHKVPTIWDRLEAEPARE